VGLELKREVMDRD